jgi:cation-transporting ATPase 13A3/4/5
LSRFCGVYLNFCGVYPLIFSVTVWYSDDYAYYASIIVLMSLLSMTMDVYQIRKQEKKLRSMVHSEDMVEVLRNGGVRETISSSMVSYF